MQDLVLTCKDCEEQFVFTAREQVFFKAHGFVTPKRCKKCRDAYKNRMKNRPVGYR